jgi:hypothetical protein
MPEVSTRLYSSARYGAFPDCKSSADNVLHRKWTLENRSKIGATGQPSGVVRIAMADATYWEAMI